VLLLTSAAAAAIFAGCAGTAAHAPPPARAQAAPARAYPRPTDQDYSVHVALLPAGRGTWKSPQAWFRPVALLISADGRGAVHSRRCGATLTGPGFEVVIDTCPRGYVRRVRAHYRASRSLRLTYRAVPAGSSGGL
jgi:hypothetical protein